MPEDSFISSQLHTNHDVCFECFQRGNTIGFQSLKDLLKISECATAKVQFKALIQKT